MFLLLCLVACDPNNSNDRIDTTSNMGNELTDNSNSADLVDKSYEAYIYAFSTSGVGAYTPLEYDIGDEQYYSSITPDENIQIQLFGTTIDLNLSEYYIKPYFILPNCYPEFTYRDKDYSTYIIDDHGMLTMFSSRKKPGETNLSQEECLQIAIDFLNNFVNIDDYQMLEITSGSSAAGEYYSFDFVKYIGEFKTTDKATVEVFRDGSIYSYRGFMIGRVDIKSKTDDIDMDKINAAVDKRIDEIYGNENVHFDHMDLSKDFKFTILRDGRRAMLCDVDFDFKIYSDKNDDSSYLLSGEKCCFVIPLD